MYEMNENEIKKYLSGSLGKDLVLYETIDSTNNAAKLLAKNGAPHGSVVLSRQQTAGKGRLGRSFFSPPGAGIYLSIILRPKTSPQETLLLTAAASVAVYRAIQKTCGIETKIKWVNDVYANGKKLCGILAESALGIHGMEYVVLGIGVNVKQTAFPASLSNKAISLDEAGAPEVDLNRLAAEILNALSSFLEGEAFLPEYRKYSCVLGREIQVIQGNDVFDAKAVSFDEQAHLLVIDKDGKERLLCSGEISLRGDFT